MRSVPRNDKDSDMHTDVEATYENHFVTHDQDSDGNSLRFNMIEDESGVFWGYVSRVPEN